MFCKINYLIKRCDKPFENSEIVEKMINVCKENNVQFMDNVRNINF
jgi:molybdopterin-guanine dinucleotide biosynthesis protein A